MWFLRPWRQSHRLSLIIIQKWSSKLKAISRHAYCKIVRLRSRRRVENEHVSNKYELISGG